MVRLHQFFLQAIEDEKTELQKLVSEKNVKVRELELKSGSFESKNSMLEARLKDVSKEWENERNLQSSSSK